MGRGHPDRQPALISFPFLPLPRIYPCSSPLEQRPRCVFRACPLCDSANHLSRGVTPSGPSTNVATARLVAPQPLSATKRLPPLCHKPEIEGQRQQPTTSPHSLPPGPCQAAKAAKAATRVGNAVLRSRPSRPSRPTRSPASPPPPQKSGAVSRRGIVIRRDRFRLVMGAGWLLLASSSSGGFRRRLIFDHGRLRLALGDVHCEFIPSPAHLHVFVEHQLARIGTLDLGSRGRHRRDRIACRRVA
jgi:hypothetical protein